MTVWQKKHCPFCQISNYHCHLSVRAGDHFYTIKLIFVNCVSVFQVSLMGSCICILPKLCKFALTYHHAYCRCLPYFLISEFNIWSFLSPAVLLGFQLTNPSHILAWCRVVGLSSLEYLSFFTSHTFHFILHQTISLTTVCSALPYLLICLPSFYMPCPRVSVVITLLAYLTYRSSHSSMRTSRIIKERT